MVERVACANSNCGTFVMDDEQYQKLQRTGEKFYCPEGHAQHFTDSTIDKKNERIQELQEQVERLREDVHDYRSSHFEEKEKRRQLERFVIAEIQRTGVIEIYPNKYIWKCKCGGHSQSLYTESKAESLYDQHRENQHNSEEVESFQCPGCGDVFDSRNARDGHRRWCEEEIEVVADES